MAQFNAEDIARSLSQAEIAKRLREARLCLDKQVMRRFGRGKHRGNTLISDDGTMALAWSVRRDESQPVGYENQQTTVGTVTLRRL